MWIPRRPSALTGRWDSGPGACAAFDGDQTRSAAAAGGARLGAVATNQQKVARWRVQTATSNGPKNVGYIAVKSDI
jgi:hypothetical protein